MSITNYFKTHKWFYFFGGILLMLLCYHLSPYLLEGKLLRTDDFDIAFAKAWYAKPWRLNGAWNQLNMLGMPDQIVLNIQYLLMLLLPPALSLSAIIAIVFIFTYFAFYILARSFNAASFVSAAMALLFTYSPFLHSYVSTGHLGRMFLVPFICLSFATLNHLLPPMPTTAQPKNHAQQNSKKKWRRHFFYGTMLATLISLSFITTAYQTALFYYFALIGYAVFLIWLNHIKLPALKHVENNWRQQPKIVAKRTSAATPLPLIKMLLKIGNAIGLINLYKDQRKHHYTNQHSFLWRKISWKPISETLITLTTAALLAALLAAHPINKAWQLTQKGEKSFLQPRNATQFSKLDNWIWATQWSFPPAESIDFFAPGVMGYSSRSETHPYWGSIGRSQELSNPILNRGNFLFKNYSITTHYFGFYAIIFFFFALTFLKKPAQFWQCMFWLAVILVCLLLSFGYHSIFYKLFYNLPTMDAMRNPNKFLQNVHFAFFIISTLGMQQFYLIAKKALSPLSNKNFQPKTDAALKIKNNSIENSNVPTEKLPLKFKAFFFNFIAAFVVILGVLYIIYVPRKSAFLIAAAVSFNKELAEKAYANIAPSLLATLITVLITSLSLLVVLKLLRRFNSKKKHQDSKQESNTTNHQVANNQQLNAGNKIALLAALTFCIAFAVFDLARVNRHFYTFEHAYYYSTPGQRMLAPLIEQKNNTPTRAQIITSGNLENFIIWRLAPYYELPLGNKRVTRRQALEFETFSQKVHFPIFLELGAINTILHTDENFAKALLPGNHKKIATINERDEVLHIFQVLRESPHVRMVSNVKIASSRQEVIHTLNSSNFSARTQAIAFDSQGIAKKTLQNFSPSRKDTPSVKIISYRPEQIHLQITGNDYGDSLLVFAAHYHHNWQAYVPNSSNNSESNLTTSSFLNWRTSKTLPHVAVNYLNNGFIVPAKTKQVVLAYSPPYQWLLHAITAFNYVLLAILLLLIASNKLKRR